MCFKILSIYTIKNGIRENVGDLLLQEMTDFDIKRLSLNYVSTISIYTFSTKNTKTRTVKLRFRYASHVNALYLFNKNMDLVLIVTVYTL